MNRTHPKTIGQVLQDFFAEHGPLYEKILEVRLQRAWQAMLGRAAAEYTSRMYVKNRVLYVYLTSSVLRSELSMIREKLVQNLNREVRATAIRDIVFR